MSSPQNRLISYDELAELWSIKKGTLQAWVHEGRLPHVRLGPRTTRFDLDELEAWVNDRRRKPRSPFLHSIHT